MHRTLQPDGWPKPRGYANGVSARGRTIHVSGQVGWDANEQLVSSDFVSQARQAMQNIAAVLACDGATPAHIVRLTWYIVDRDAYRSCGAQLGLAYREIMGRHYPAMSAVQVCALMEAGALVEIEATAIVPDDLPAAERGVPESSA